jgi:Protein of unknown function (DUF2818)
MWNQTVAVTVVLILAVLAANLPFLNNRLGLIGPLCQPKKLLWRLLELLVLAIVVVALGMLFEKNLGQNHPQQWPFYVAMLCLFLTLAFPGFVWRYLAKT